MESGILCEKTELKSGKGTISFLWDLIKDRSPVIMYGDMGKTYTLRKLFLDLRKKSQAHQIDFVPLYIDLERTLVGFGVDSSLEEIITAYIRNNLFLSRTDNDGVKSDEVKEVLKKGEMILLLDHYEALEDQLGRKRMRYWELSNERILTLNKLLIACNRRYFEERESVGLFKEGCFIKLEDLDLKSEQNREARQGMYEHLLRRYGNLKYFSPSLSRMMDVERRFNKFKFK
jgi:hypothetical protein